VAIARVDGLDLFYELSGDGAPLVLVHGSWTSHRSWDLLVPRLAGSFRVLRYDRRGHSASGRPSGQGSVRQDVADLAALIEQLGLAPAWLVGNSFGGSIALRLAAERPDLLRGLAAHEPPLFGLLAGDAGAATLLAQAGPRIAAVLARIASGAHADAAEQFMDGVALGPGAWAALPAELRQIAVENAPTFLDEASDPEQLAFDLAWLDGFRRPTLLSRGDQSPPIFAPVVAKLAAALPHAEVRIFRGAGHIPHATHPDVYADALRAFARR
jgi:pimeloyl-ACP methyl ester carboxylesterase